MNSTTISTGIASVFTLAGSCVVKGAPRWSFVISDDGLAAYSAHEAANRMLEMCNRHSSAVQMWLSSGQYGGMTLEEFLEQTQTEVTQ